MPFLKMKVNGKDEAFPLDRDIVILGRSTENALYVDDRQASRNHCQVERFPGGWKLVDLASRNGTRVNGVTVNQHLLKSGDRIEIGDTAIVFLDAPDETDPRIPGIPKAAQPAAPVPGVAGLRAPTTGAPTPPAAPRAAPAGYPTAAPAAYPPAAPPPYPPYAPAGGPPYPPAGTPAYPPPYGAPPAGYPPAGPSPYPPAGYPAPAGQPPYPPASGPTGAPAWAPYPPPPAGGAPPMPPGLGPPQPHPSSPPSAERRPQRAMPSPSQGVNPGIIVGIGIVALALLIGGTMILNSNRGSGGGQVSEWKKTLQRGEELYKQGKWDEASAEFRKIPKESKEYKNAQTYIGDIIQRKKAEEEGRAAAALQAAWEPLRERIKKFDAGELPKSEEAALLEEIRLFVQRYPAAAEVSRARDAYARLGGDPKEIGTGTPPPDRSKDAEAEWSRLSQRVEMHERGDLPPEEVDRLKAELRNFVVRFNEYPEAAQAQQKLRGMGGGSVEVPPTPPAGDPKNFGELTKLVDGLAGNSSYGEAVRLLEEWINKDPTGPDATPAEDKRRELRKAGENWYLQREAEADSLAQGGKFKEAKEILDEAVKKLSGAKAFFESTEAAKKKIAGLEQAMGGGK